MNYTKEQEEMCAEIVKVYGFQGTDEVKRHIEKTQQITTMLFSGVIRNKLELYQVIDNEYPTNLEKIMAAYGIGAAQAHFVPDMWGKKP